MEKALVYRHILTFPVGFKQARASRILPVFLPFAGCPQRCVFCAQDKQTGTKPGDDKKNLFQILASIYHSLADFNNNNVPELATITSKYSAFGGENATHGVGRDYLWLPQTCPPSLSPVVSKTSAELPELAFYGGTFTALPTPLLQQCLNFYHTLHEQGLVSCCRCSTRPDAVSEGVLNLIQKSGLDLVELGIQSFDDAALLSSQRGYSAQQAWQGCLRVKEAGFQLGIQLLPGMPGVTPAIFLRDVEAALSCQPDCLRFYPCLVPEGTALAEAWRRKKYTPWTLEETVVTLSHALQMAWQKRVPVLRLSVAPEASFDTAVLAGPRHPALGAMIQAEALLRTVERLLIQLPPTDISLWLPRSCQGYLYGQGGTLRSRWEMLGFPAERIHFTAEAEARLCAN